MQNEHEGNLNVMRALLELCEEGATDEITDCAADGEPWTEDDRRSSRATAEWLRATLFTPTTKARGKPRIRKSSGELLFSDDRIRAQLESPDPERRRCAVAALDAVAKLATLRAKRLGTSFSFERELVFDIGLLDADVEGDDLELSTVALDVWDEVSHLDALVAVDTYVPTDEDREWADQVRARIKVQLDELRKRVAEDRDTGGAP